VQRIDLPHATVHNDADLDAWLNQVRAQIQAKLGDGPVML